jgi:Ca-activated chloride channel family protein
VTRRRICGWLLVGCLLALPGIGQRPAAAAEPRITFEEPRHNAVAIGSTPIRLRLDLPTGTAVEQVEIRVDGKLLTVLTAPPWNAVWDAGDGARFHRLSATLRLADGTEKKANIRTAALRINQVEEVGLVALYPIVRNRGGYVSDLTRNDFVVKEDGQPQTISRFSKERKPLRIGIVLDASQSMENDDRIRDARDAALDFLDVLAEGDEGMIVTFNDTVEVTQELTAEPASLAQAISSVEARGGTALYDAIWRTSKKLAAFEGRRVLVLLSDGKDESYDGLEPGSLHTLDEALDQALRAEVMVFAIGLGRRFSRELDFDRRYTLKAILDQLAGATGGRALISPRSGQLRKAFREVAEDLRNQYSLAYTSTNPERDGGWRTVEVSVPAHQGAEVISRQGYFAGTPAGARDGG